MKNVSHGMPGTLVRQHDDLIRLVFAGVHDENEIVDIFRLNLSCYLHSWRGLPPIISVELAPEVHKVLWTPC